MAEPLVKASHAAVVARPMRSVPMSGQFEAVVEIDRPVKEVYDYLADGRNDPQFSPRVLRIERIPETPTAVGTVFRSTVKDAGMKTAREFRITELDAPV